jgi:hypothetical protein
LTVLAVGWWSCAIEKAPGHDSTGGEEDLTDLVALPYLSWSDEQADPEKLGVTLWDEERAWAGFNLYTNDVNEAYLMDMGGRRVHTWALGAAYSHCEHFELLTDGEIVAVCVGEALVRLDRDSNVVWSLSKPVHHDVAVLEDGSFIVPRRGKLREYQGRRVGFDALMWVAGDGEILDHWRTWNHLGELQRHHRSSTLDESHAGPPLKKSHDYYHLNTVEVLPDTPLGRQDRRFRAGNILICLRNVNLILILDHDTREVAWAWGDDDLEMPHMPTMLPNGNILVYDNGVWSGRTRVIELDPASEQIVWVYEGEPLESFFSKRRGSNQRLPNGNTLIADSESGRAFEVTAAGETVWEFWNPELMDDRRKRIYRLMRRSEEDVKQCFRRSSLHRGSD